MHLVADRLTGLSSLMDSHPTVYEESSASEVDPVVRQEEERLMYKQLQIQGQMGLIQAALRSLTGALVKMQAQKQEVLSSRMFLYCVSVFLFFFYSNTIESLQSLL